MTDEATTLEIVLYNKRSSLGVECIRVFLDQCLGEVVDMLGKPIVEVFNNLQTLIRFFPEASRLAAQEP